MHRSIFETGGVPKKIEDKQETNQKLMIKIKNLENNLDNQK